MLQSMGSQRVGHDWATKRRRQWHPTPVLLPGKSHGWWSLVGCSPWGIKESDMTERLHFHFSLSCIGEGNGNLFQCSCLENPRDRGACWAAVYGVAQSRTRLKQLSSRIYIINMILAACHIFYYRLFPQTPLATIGNSFYLSFYDIFIYRHAF